MKPSEYHAKRAEILKEAKKKIARLDQADAREKAIKKGLEKSVKSIHWLGEKTITVSGGGGNPTDQRHIAAGMPFTINIY